MSEEGKILSINKLPYECTKKFLNELGVNDKISAGLTCHRWMHLLKEEYSIVSDLRIVLEDDQCLAQSSVQTDGTVLILTMCMCKPHIDGHMNLVHMITMMAGRSIKQLVIEDYLLAPHACMSSELLEIIVQNCRGLETLQLHQVDLREVAPDLLLKISHFDGLNNLVMDSCSSNMHGILGDALLVRVGLRGILSQIRFTNSVHLTDKALKAIALSCPQLTHCDFSGCRQVSSEGVCYFILSMNKRCTDMLYLKVTDTVVNGWGIQQKLQGNGRENGWSFSQFHILVSGPRAACIQNKLIPSKAVIIMS